MYLNIILLIFLSLTFNANAQLAYTPDKVVKDFQKLFSPEFEQEGLTFLIETFDKGNNGLAWVWRNPTYSWIYLDKNIFSPNLPFPSKDALLGILCHELGHLRSPYLQVPDVFGTGLSIASEGEADYYATNSCLKLIFQETSTNWSPDNHFIHTFQEKKEFEYLQKICSENFSEVRKQKICIRSSLAAYQALQNGRFDYLRNEKEELLQEISFSTPSSHISIETIREDYPSDQCRLDTALAGALNQPRPACWFYKF